MAELINDEENKKNLSEDALDLELEDIEDSEDSEDFDDSDDADEQDNSEDIDDNMFEDTDENLLNKGIFSKNFFNTSRDNTVEWYTGQTRVTVTMSQRKWVNKIKRLAAKNPDEVEISINNQDGSIVAHLPLSYIKISPPKRVSAEQKERMRQQAQKNIAEGKFGRKKKVQVDE